MARTRLLRPEFFTHGELYDAERASGLPLRLAYAGLWCQADRAGRFVWNPRVLKLDVMPYDDIDFGEVLDALEHYGFLVRYVVDGKAYGHIPTFGKHQTFHKTERPSVLPPPPGDNGDVTVNTPLGNGGLPDSERAVTVAVTGTVTVAGTDNNHPVGADAPVVRKPRRARRPSLTPYSPLFVEAWSIYPARPGNSKAEAWEQWQRRVGEGVSEEHLLERTRVFAAYANARTWDDRGHILMARTFYGPHRRFDDDYSLPSAPRRPSAPLPFPRASDPNAEAGDLLAQIATLQQTAVVPGQGAHRFIRKDDIESRFGPEVLRAVVAIGGPSRILETSADRWGLLIRDFAGALDRARSSRIEVPA